MGPVVGNTQHEGWVVPLFADGAEGAGSESGQGILVRTRAGAEEWRPDAAVVGWAAGCDCGWRGPPWTRVAPEAADPGMRLLAAADGSWHYLPEADEQLVVDEWREHIAPWTSLEEVSEAAARHARSAQDLDSAVLKAKVAGASWADIGRATNMTRQSANERWGRLA